MLAPETRYASPDKLQDLYRPISEWTLEHGALEDNGYEVVGVYNEIPVVDCNPPIVGAQLGTNAVHRHAWEFSDRFEVGNQLSVSQILPHYRGSAANGSEPVGPNNPPRFYEAGGLVLRITKHLASRLKSEALYIKDDSNVPRISRWIEQRSPGSQVQSYGIFEIPQGEPGSINLKEFVGLAALADAVQLHDPAQFRIANN